MIDKFEIIFFDVGLGDCILCRCNNTTLLIDGGRYYSNSLRKYIAENNIKKIDYVICTHGHEDHVDGLAAIMAEVDFGNVFCNIDKLPSKVGFSKMLSIIEDKKKRIQIPLVNDTFKISDAEVKFLSPENRELYKNGNDCSLVIKITYKGYSILLMADAGVKVMEDMLMKKMEVKSNIIKIPHHGLESIPEEFLNEVDPNVAVITWGENEYGKVSEELISVLENKGIDIFRSDVDGDIYCCIDEDDIMIRSLA